MFALWLVVGLTLLTLQLLTSGSLVNDLGYFDFFSHVGVFVAVVVGFVVMLISLFLRRYPWGISILGVLAWGVAVWFLTIMTIFFRQTF